MLRHSRHLFGALLLGIAMLVLAACGGDADGGDADQGDERLRVVATTGVIAEFAREVAGDDAVVSQIVPSGVDVHAFELTPDAIRRIAEADLVLVNGYNLEEGLLGAVREGRSTGSSLVVVSAGLEPLSGGLAHEEDAEDGDHAPPDGTGTGSGTDAEALALMSAEGDPHFWLDPHLASGYVAAIRDALVAADPEHAAAYRDRAAAYLDRLDALDAEVAAAIAGVPAERRKLVVFHDAFGYFAAAYDIEIVATLVPGGANAEPSASEVGAVVEAIRQYDVRAVYAEPQFSSQLIEAVADEAGVPVLTLYSDATGEGVANYEAMMRANARAIADGLGDPA